MSEFKAWANIFLFGGLGLFVLSGHSLPYDASCQVRCFTNSMVRLQESIGDVQLAGILFFCGVFGFVWYTLRF